MPFRHLLSGYVVLFNLCSSACARSIFMFFFVQKDLPAGKGDVNEELLAIPPSTGLGYSEDLSEYRFQKFAATYFQSNATHQYSRKPLKSSLLLLQTQGDQLVKISFLLLLLAGQLLTT